MNIYPLLNLTDNNISLLNPQNSASALALLRKDMSEPELNSTLNRAKTLDAESVFSDILKEVKKEEEKKGDIFLHNR